MFLEIQAAKTGKFFYNKRRLQFGYESKINNTG